MRWKLSHIEHIVDVNIVCVVRLDGGFPVDRLGPALTRLQRRHPALRALIREEPDGLYYEADSAPEIPLRVVARMREDDYPRECRTELTTGFAHDQPQLRAVCLQSEPGSDLLFTTTHRMCDGMSVFIIVREVLRSIYTDEETIPYEPATVRDIVGDYQPSRLWMQKVAASLINGIVRLIPRSRRPLESNVHSTDVHSIDVHSIDVHSMEWRACRALSEALKQRCRSEGVSVHAVLFAALECTLFAVFGRESPKSIVNPIDLRRGRFTALKSDMVFFGGGNFKIRTEQPPGDFWLRVRAINEEIQKAVEEEIRNIPARFSFLEMVRPLSGGQIRRIMQLSDALKAKPGWNSFGLSNLGNVVVADSDAPFRVKDLRLYVHSFSLRMLGLIPYTVNGEMSFYWVIDDSFMSRAQLDLLGREFMTLLRDRFLPADVETGEALRAPAVAATR